MGDPERKTSGMQAAGGGGGGGGPYRDRPTVPPLSSQSPEAIDEEREFLMNADQAAITLATWRRLDQITMQMGAKVAEYDEKRTRELIERDKLRDEVQQRRERVRDDTINKALNQVTGALTDVSIKLELQENEQKKLLSAITNLSNQVLDLGNRVHDLERAGKQRDNAIAALKHVDDETLVKLDQLAKRVNEIGALIKDKTSE